MATPLTPVRMAKEPPSTPASPMDDRFAELEAMGGDPFFLSEDDEEEEKESISEMKDSPQDDKEDDAEPTALSAGFMMSSAALSTESPATRFVTDGLGPSPKTGPPKPTVESEKKEDDVWEWDGIVNEDAHLDLDDW
ncbi:MAG: hypothetical protein SGILL_005849 [Bacillariaceae sp.]